MRPGEQLRELRNRLGITTREVEEFSRTIAEDSQNEEFYISDAWLTQLENKNSVPSMYKLYSLSAIYRTKFNDLLVVFGIDLNATTLHQLAVPLQSTHLVSVESPDPEKTIVFPVRFDKNFSLEKTSLVARMVEVWGEVPIALIQKLDVRHSQYGYVGTQDYTLNPLLRPGSFVQIDSHPNRGGGEKWHTEFDRPIYFVELRDGYSCSWCEVRGSQITLIPHPPLGVHDPAICLSCGGGDHWTSDGRGHAPGSLIGRTLRRASKIAKATVKFENRNSASSGSGSTFRELRKFRRIGQNQDREVSDR